MNLRRYWVPVLVLAFGVVLLFGVVNRAFEIGSGLAFDHELTIGNMSPSEYGEGFNEPRQRNIREASIGAGWAYARLMGLSLFCVYLLVVLAFAYPIKPSTFTHRRTLLLAVVLCATAGTLLALANVSIGNPFSYAPSSTGVTFAIFYFLSFYGLSALIYGAKRAGLGLVGMAGYRRT